MRNSTDSALAYAIFYDHFSLFIFLIVRNKIRIKKTIIFYGSKESFKHHLPLWPACLPACSRSLLWKLGTYKAKDCCWIFVFTHYYGKQNQIKVCFRIVLSLFTERITFVFFSLYLVCGIASHFLRHHWNHRPWRMWIFALFHCFHDTIRTRFNQNSVRCASTIFFHHRKCKQNGKTQNFRLINSSGMEW